MDIYIILICLAFSALFSGVEIAFISSDKLEIELKKNKGLAIGRRLQTFVNNPSDFIGTTLIGNTIALVVYGIFMTTVLEPPIRSFYATNIPQLKGDFSVNLTQTILSTIIVLVTAEFLPKSIFMLKPNRMLEIFSLPMLFFYYVMKPLVFIIIIPAKLFITKVLRIDYSEEQPAFGLTDLDNYIKRISIQTAQVDENGETTAEVDVKMLSNALEFKTIRVKDCLVPRTDIKAVDIEDGIEALHQMFIETEHSKLLIYEESIDNIIGYCHSTDMFSKPASIKPIVKPLIVVPSIIYANDLMIRMISERTGIALVVDEYGGTEGIVCIEDIIEEIFGEIQDEHDDEQTLCTKVDDFTYIIDARIEIDLLNNDYGFDIPIGDYETLGGYIINEIEDLPVLNDVIEREPYTFTVVGMDNNRIETIRLTVDAND